MYFIKLSFHTFYELWKIIFQCYFYSFYQVLLSVALFRHMLKFSILSFMSLKLPHILFMYFPVLASSSVMLPLAVSHMLFHFSIELNLSNYVFISKYSIWFISQFAWSFYSFLFSYCDFSFFHFFNNFKYVYILLLYWILGCQFFWYCIYMLPGDFCHVFF